MGALYIFAKRMDKRLNDTGRNDDKRNFGGLLEWLKW
jgi:hypothetical protein